MQKNNIQKWKKKDVKCKRFAQGQVCVMKNWVKFVNEL